MQNFPRLYIIKLKYSGYYFHDCIILKIFDYKGGGGFYILKYFHDMQSFHDCIFTTYDFERSYDCSFWKYKSLTRGIV